MKEIGRTVDGSYIVEMTEYEIQAFGRLAQVMEGETVWEAVEMRRVANYDIGTALECVMAFANIMGSLNDVKQQVDFALAELTALKHKEV